jgi:diaminopimelate epimerase
MKIPFVKMHGIGNDFVMIDTFRSGTPAGSIAELARRVSDRKFGIGGDGLILVERGDKAPFRMRMFNPDGSESEMCGNGIRCVVRLLRDHGHVDGDTVSVETGAGVLNLEMLGDGRVRVEMGFAKLTRGEIGMEGNPNETFVEQPLGEGFEYVGTAVSMGNPHLAIFVDDVEAVDLGTVGPRLECNRLFRNRVNVHFVQVVDRTHAVQRTWERGAGITLACGTGACAAAVAGALTGRTDSIVNVSLPGGDLEIEVCEDGSVTMTGPATSVYRGEWSA